MKTSWTHGLTEQQEQEVRKEYAQSQANAQAKGDEAAASEA